MYIGMLVENFRTVVMICQFVHTTCVNNGWAASRCIFIVTVTFLYFYTGCC